MAKIIKFEDPQKNFVDYVITALWLVAERKIPKCLCVLLICVFLVCSLIYKLQVRLVQYQEALQV